jgi:hypothetical protein
MAVKQQQLTSKRRVQFCETQNQVEVVETVENEEKASMWYTEKDLDSFTYASDNESSSSSSPLLEQRSSEQAFTTELDRQLQKEFVMALLQQQLEHKKLGVNDPKRLFQFSRACSKKSRQQALKQARAHEQEVEELNRRERGMQVLDSVLLDVVLQGFQRKR